MTSQENYDDPIFIATGLLPLLKEYTKKFRERVKEARLLQNRRAELSGSSSSPGVPIGSPKTSGVALQDIQKASTRIDRDFGALQQGFHRMGPATTQLVQQASQLATHGKLDILTRLELSLRLAEFESALQEARTVISAGPQG